MKELKLNRSLWNNKSYDIIIVVYNNPNIIKTKISKDIDVTYSYTSRVIKNLEALDIVKCIPNKRITNVFITKKGKEIAKILIELRSIISAFS